MVQIVTAENAVIRGTVEWDGGNFIRVLNPVSDRTFSLDRLAWVGMRAVEI
jgi:hypothetical protein